MPNTSGPFGVQGQTTPLKAIRPRKAYSPAYYPIHATVFSSLAGDKFYAIMRVLSDTIQNNSSVLVTAEDELTKKEELEKLKQEKVVVSAGSISVSIEDEKPTRLTKEVTIDTDLDTTTPSVSHVTSLFN